MVHSAGRQTLVLGDANGEAEIARGKAWTDEDRERVLEMVGQRKSDAQIAAEVGRTASAVAMFISRLGGRPDEDRLVVGGAWSDGDRELAGLMLALGMTHQQVAAGVSRSEGTIASQLCRGRITAARDVAPLDRSLGDRRPWTEDEDTLTDLLARRGWTSLRIAGLLGRTEPSTQSRMSRLGIVGTRYPSRQKPQGSWRPCMCCQKSFRSEGIHNRICSVCKDSDLFT